MGVGFAVAKRRHRRLAPATTISNGTSVPLRQWLRVGCRHLGLYALWVARATEGRGFYRAFPDFDN